MVGELNSPMDENKFLSFLKKKMKSKLIKHSIKLGENLFELVCIISYSIGRLTFFFVYLKLFCEVVLIK